MKSTKATIWIYLHVSLLTLTLLLPYGLKLVHALEFHQAVECSHSQSHLHQYKPHCDYLDYCFQQLPLLPVDEEFPLIIQEFTPLVIFQPTLLQMQSIQHVASRGPPAFVI